MPDYDDLPEVEKPFFARIMEAIFLLHLLYNNKPPKDAKDPNGVKAPGKPGEKNGFRDPKGGEKWVKNPNFGKGGASHGWLDDKGRVWVPTGKSPLRAHGGEHWDVQIGDDNINVYPDEHIEDKLKRR